MPKIKESNPPRPFKRAIIVEGIEGKVELDALREWVKKYCPYHTTNVDANSLSCRLAILFRTPCASIEYDPSTHPTERTYNGLIDFPSLPMVDEGGRIPSVNICEFKGNYACQLDKRIPPTKLDYPIYPAITFEELEKEDAPKET